MSTDDDFWDWMLFEEVSEEGSEGGGCCLVTLVVLLIGVGLVGVVVVLSRWL